MGILQTRIWPSQIPLSRCATLLNAESGPEARYRKSGETRFENSSRITGKPEVISSPVALVPTNTLEVIDEPTPGWSASGSNPLHLSRGAARRLTPWLFHAADWRRVRRCCVAASSFPIPVGVDLHLRPNPNRNQAGYCFTNFRGILGGCRKITTR